MASELFETTVGEVCQVFDGPHATPTRLDHGPVFLGITSLNKGRIDLTTSDHVSEEDFAKWTRRITPKPGDVVFSYETKLGEAAIIPEGLRCCLGRRMGLMRPNPQELDSRFLLYYYLGPEFQDVIRARTIHGSTVDRIALIEFPKFPLRIPPLPEQKRIAHILGTLDDKIELNRRMNATLEAIAQALFKSWFVDFDPVRAKASGELEESICQRLGLTREVLALFPDRLVESELGEIPAGWEVRSLETLVDIIKGKSYRSDELADSDTALVTLKSFLRGGGYRADGLKAFTGEYKPNQVIHPGELVVAFTDVTQAADVIGKPAIVRSDEQFKVLVASLDVGIVRPKDAKVSIPFLYSLFMTEIFQNHTYAHTSGTTVLHLGKNGIPTFLALIPTPKIALEFKVKGTNLHKKIDANYQESRTLAKLRDTLLPKLLSGELSVAEAGEVVEGAM